MVGGTSRGAEVVLGASSGEREGERGKTGLVGWERSGSCSLRRAESGRVRST